MSILPIVSGFVFHYPLFMAFAWMMGALLYRLGRAPRDLKDTPQLAEYPKVSVLIPCHNEAACIEDVIGRMAALDYPD